MTAIPFVAHSGFFLAGTTKAGKTTWLKKLLMHANQMFDKPPQRVLYCYTVYQPVFDDMLKTNETLNFHRGMPTEQTIRTLAADTTHTILILDDMADQVVNSQQMTDLFTKYNHHLGISTFFIVQNLFTQGKHARTIYLNCHYLILFKSLRDKGQIAIMGRQILGSRGKSLVEAYEDAMSTKFNYLVVDISPHVNDQYRMRSFIFPEKETVIYTPKS